jgi:hypothetical protein
LRKAESGAVNLPGPIVYNYPVRENSPSTFVLIGWREKRDLVTSVGVGANATNIFTCVLFVRA